MVLVQPLDTGKITQPIYVVICKVVNADAWELISFCWTRNSRNNY
jgi:hypothetical protein